MTQGIKRHELAARYDVERFSEDRWHTYSGAQTAKWVSKHLVHPPNLPSVLLNAGAGVYELNIPGWTEIAVDLFETPIKNRKDAMQGNIESLQFPDQMFGAVICVGEVLGYCDPQKVISEFSRVTSSSGLLMCDFGSTRSFRRWFRKEHGRAADLVRDYYNGTPEQIWIYDPAYIESLLISFGFKIIARHGTHTWSAFARRIGMSSSAAIDIQQRLEWWKLPIAWADVTTFFAVRL